MPRPGWLLLWAAIFFAFLATVIRFWEEPHLVQRFGSEYVDYRHNVPGWIPRISAWNQAWSHSPRSLLRWWLSAEDPLQIGFHVLQLLTQ